MYPQTKPCSTQGTFKGCYSYYQRFNNGFTGARVSEEKQLRLSCHLGRGATYNVVKMEELELFRHVPLCTLRHEICYDLYRRGGRCRKHRGKSLFDPRDVQKASFPKSVNSAYHAAQRKLVRPRRQRQRSATKPIQPQLRGDP